MWETPMGENCPWIVPAGQEAHEWVPIATLGDCLEDGPSPRSKAFREIQANARLIAAAPELLEALEWAVNDMHGVTKYTDPEQWNNCMALAEAAIARAKGASS